jgi:hypothetical protein
VIGRDTVAVHSDPGPDEQHRGTGGAQEVRQQRAEAECLRLLMEKEFPWKEPAANNAGLQQDGNVTPTRRR